MDSHDSNGIFSQNFKRNNCALVQKPYSASYDILAMCSPCLSLYRFHQIHGLVPGKIQSAILDFCKQKLWPLPGGGALPLTAVRVC